MGVLVRRAQALSKQSHHQSSSLWWRCQPRKQYFHFCHLWPSVDMKNEVEEKIEFPRAFFFFGSLFTRNLPKYLLSDVIVFLSVYLLAHCITFRRMRVSAHTSFDQFHSMRGRINGSNETILCAFCSCLVGHWTTISIGLLWLSWMGAVVCVCVCARTQNSVYDARWISARESTQIDSK